MVKEWALTSPETGPGQSRTHAEEQQLSGGSTTRVAALTREPSDDQEKQETTEASCPYCRESCREQVGGRSRAHRSSKRHTCGGWPQPHARAAGLRADRVEGITRPHRYLGHSRVQEQPPQGKSVTQLNSLRNFKFYIHSKYIYAEYLMMQNVRGYKYYGEKSLQNYTQYDLNLKLMMNIKKKTP